MSRSNSPYYRKERDEIVEKTMSLFGYELANDFGKSPTPGKEAYYLLNECQATGLDRSKKGFISGTYQGFDIMKHEYDGWNAKHTIKRNDEVITSYNAYIKLGSYYVLLVKAGLIVSSEKLKDFAEGRVPKEEAEAEGIASQIKKKYYELYLETHGF